MTKLDEWLPRRLTRRGWLARTLRMAAPVLAAGGGALAAGEMAHGRRRIEIRRVTIAVADLPGGFHGFRIVQLSDLHLRPWTGPDEIDHAVEAALELRGDAIALTGDFMTHDASAAGELGGLLARLEAPAGVFACLGNHDFHGRGAERVTSALRAAGVIVLRNAVVPLDRRGDRIFVAGLDSRRCGRPRLDAALSPCRPESRVLLLMHEPDFADVAARDGRVAVQLSGHSHGGQIRVPGLPPLVTPRWARRYTEGAYRVGPLALYVNRGIGCTGVPLRLFCPPEVTEITLRAG